MITEYPILVTVLHRMITVVHENVMEVEALPSSWPPHIRMYGGGYPCGSQHDE